MKGKVLRVVLCVILSAAFMFTSCGTLGDQGSSGDDKLYVYNWGLYIDESVLDEFEEEFGIKVIYDKFDTNESMYQRFTNSNISYDVMIPSDYMISKLMKEDNLLKLDKSKIPNLEYMISDIMELSETFDPGNEYAVPYTWGTLGILYNTEKMEEPTSWDVFWDAQYSKKIFMYDSQRDTIGMALKRLGYSLNTTNIAELNEAVDSLLVQKPLTLKYLGDEVIQGMVANEAWMALVYNGDAVDIMDKNDKLDYVIPDEGTNLFVDAMVIPKNSKNVDAAHKFINFMCRKDIALKNTLEIGYSTPHSEAFEALDDDWKEDPAYWPMADIEENKNTNKYEVFYDIGEFIKEYDKAWNKITGGK